MDYKIRSHRCGNTSCREEKMKADKYSVGGRKSGGTYPSIVVGGITVVAGAIAGAGAGKTGGPGGGRPPPTGLQVS